MIRSSVGPAMLAGEGLVAALRSPVGPALLAAFVDGVQGAVVESDTCSSEGGGVSGAGESAQAGKAPVAPEVSSTVPSSASAVAQAPDESEDDSDQDSGVTGDGDDTAAS